MTAWADPLERYLIANTNFKGDFFQLILPIFSFLFNSEHFLNQSIMWVEKCVATHMSDLSFRCVEVGDWERSLLLETEDGRHLIFHADRLKRFLPSHKNELQIKKSVCIHQLLRHVNWNKTTLSGLGRREGVTSINSAAYYLHRRFNKGYFKCICATWALNLTDWSVALITRLQNHYQLLSPLSQV